MYSIISIILINGLAYSLMVERCTLSAVNRSSNLLKPTVKMSEPRFGWIGKILRIIYALLLIWLIIKIYPNHGSDNQRSLLGGAMVSTPGFDPGNVGSNPAQTTKCCL